MRATVQPILRLGFALLVAWAPCHAAASALQTCVDVVFRAGMESTGTSAPCRVAGSTVVFTDRALFLAALANGHVENAYDDVVAGTSGGLRYVQSRFEYLLYTQFFADGPLYNGLGFVSTERVGDSVVVTQLGIPATAIGADFWTTGFLLQPADGAIGLQLDDGTFESIDAPGSGTFRGFITTAPILSLTVSVSAAAAGLTGAGSPDRWPALDNLVVGNGK